MPENTQRTPTPREALNLIDQWLAKLSGPGFDRAAHIQMQAAVQIVQHALPTEGAVEPEVLTPRPTPSTS